MKPLLGSLLALVFLALPALAQESDDDIFAEGAFDDAVAVGQASEDANKLVWLGGVTLASTTTLVLPEDLDRYASLSQFAGKGFLKATRPTLGSLFVAYTYNHTLWAATDDPVFSKAYARAQLDPSTPAYTLSEFHVSFDVNKLVFLRVGNQLIDWGASAVWSPADFINRRVADPNAALDTRAGKPGVRVHVPWAGGNFFVFADASRSLTKEGVPRDLTKTGTLGLKADTTVVGWNLGLIGNVGKTSDPRAGLTASGSFLGVDLWGEVGTVVPGQDREGTWSASVGGERSFGLDSEWTVRGEGYWNPEGNGNVELAGGTLANYTPFYWGKAYVYGEVVKKKLLGPDITASLSSTANLSDRSWSSTASLRTAFSGLVPFSLYTQYNGGKSLREFTLATGGPAWTLGLRSLLEF